MTKFRQALSPSSLDQFDSDPFGDLGCDLRPRWRSRQVLRPERTSAADKQKAAFAPGSSFVWRTLLLSQHTAMHYDRCTDALFSAICNAETAVFWL